MIEQARPWLWRLFAKFEDRGIVYVALRINQQLLETGRELDILVHPDSLKPLLDVIAATCQEEGDLRVAYWREYPRSAATVVLASRRLDDSWEQCVLDIRSGVHKKGVLLIDGTKLTPDNRVLDEQLHLRRLPDALESALLLLRNALDERKMSPRHQAILNARASGDTGEAARRLGFDYHALRAGKPSRVRPANPIRLTRYRIRAAYGRTRARTAGLNIALYGPDGVGKTSQAQELASFLHNPRVRATRPIVYHAFVKAEDLVRYASSKSAALRRRTYLHAATHTIRKVLLVLSYLKRLAIYAVRLRRSIRKGAIIIHDRYLFDVFLKFYKAHGRRYPRLEWRLSRFVPATDLVLVLRADPEIVAMRGGELSPDAVRSAYEILDHCLEASRSIVVNVDANRDLEMVRSELGNHVLLFQTKRFTERLPHSKT